MFCYALIGMNCIQCLNDKNSERYLSNDEAIQKAYGIIRIVHLDDQVNQWLKSHGSDAFCQRARKHCVEKHDILVYKNGFDIEKQASN